jgi:hypothetical protein
MVFVDDAVSYANKFCLKLSERHEFSRNMITALVIVHL